MPVGVLPIETGTVLHTGSAILDFGGAPGSSSASVVVGGQAGLPAGAPISVWWMGDTTASHNAVEHEFVPVKVSAGNIVPGVSFTVHAYTDLRLSGTFEVRWSWST